MSKRSYKRSRMRGVPRLHYSKEKIGRKSACAIHDGNSRREARQPQYSDASDSKRKGVLLLDQTKLDIHLRDNDGAPRPSCKPWLTIAIDAWSRQVVGFEVSMIPPGPKDLKRLLTASTRRIGRGDQGRAEPLPEICVDSGLDFNSRVTSDLSNGAGMKIRCLPPSRLGSKPVIERFFSTVNRKFIEETSGGVRGDRARPAEEMESDRRLTPSEFKTLIEEAIEENNRRKK